LNKNYWVYILHCENNCYYTGYTTDLTKRYKAHLNGTASKYTRSFKPIKIVQYWQVENKSIAMQLENYIKKLSRQDKEKIIDKPDLLPTVTKEN
jgi:putative endonuclease